MKTSMLDKTTVKRMIFATIAFAILMLNAFIPEPQRQPFPQSISQNHTIANIMIR